MKLQMNLGGAQVGKLGLHNALHIWAQHYGAVFECWFGKDSIVVISGGKNPLCNVLSYVYACKK